MKVHTTTQKANGSCLQGYIITTYAELEQHLGSPIKNFCGDCKVDCEWIIEDNGDIATIYNWKTGGIPYGKHRWHIGGHGEQSVHMITKMFPHLEVFVASFN